MQTIEILDPGLQRLGGHHFDLNLFLADELKRRGYKVRLWGSDDASRNLVEVCRETGLELTPLFRDRPYRVAREVPKAPSSLPILQNQLSVDLAQVPSDSLWFWPTTFGHYLGPAWRTATSTHQYFGVFWSPSFRGRFWASVWQSALASTHHSETPKIFTYDDGLSVVYRRYFPSLDLGVAPYPWRLPELLTHSDKTSGRRLRVGLLGYQREERGLPILAELIRKLVEKDFHVVLQNSQGSLQIRGNHPRIECLGWVRDFGALVRSCDIVLWPSNPVAYQERTSGVVPDCIANGVPVVLPSGCLPAETAARFGCGHLFHEERVESMVQAVEEVRNHLDRARKRASCGASRWRATQGLVHWGDWWERVLTKQLT